MTIHMIFWLAMSLWLILGAGPSMKSGPKGIGTALLPWACVCLIGWQVFGAPVQ